MPKSSKKITSRESSHDFIFEYFVPSLTHLVWCRYLVPVPLWNVYLHFHSFSALISVVKNRKWGKVHTGKIDIKMF